MFCSHRNNTFIWNGIDDSGKRIYGYEQAHDKKTAITTLKKQAITLLNIKRQRAWRTQILFSSQQLIHFTQQFAQLIIAGLSISQALTLIADGFRAPRLSFWIRHLKKSIDDGMSLAAALAQYPQQFNAVYCAIIQMGEHSGKLGEALTELVDYLERIHYFKHKIRKTMFYPATVIIVAALVTVGLLWFVIPQFQQTFAAFGAQLPWLTRAFINLATALHHDAWQIITIIFGLFFSSRYLQKNNPIIIECRDAVLLKIPIINHIIFAISLAIWIKILKTTVIAGIPLLDALHIANGTITNRVLQKIFASLPTAINHGESLHAAMKHCAIFPAQSVQLIFVGESSGRLPHMLQKLVAIHQQQLDDLLNTFTELLEPTIMIVLALFASLLIVAMYLPIFRMGAAL